jgi:hypothetical protein
MRPVSDEFLAALTGSHKMVARARIASHASPTALGATLPILSGSVTLDATADVRARLDMTIQGAWPTAADVAADGRVDGTALLPNPYGVQVHVSRGVEFGNGSLELAQLGVFVVTGITQTGKRDSPEIRIVGQDRSCLVAEAKANEPVLFDASTTWSKLFIDVLGGAHSLLTAEFDFDAVATSVGAVLLLEDGADRWRFLLDAVKAIGKTAWFDHEGICQVADIPDPGVPVWTVAAGRGGVLVDSGRSMTRDGQYNGVLAVGEAATDRDPVRGFASDIGAGSMTAWGDAFGRRLTTIQSPIWATDIEAEAAAAVHLTRTTGIPYSLDLSAVPNPALEPWDVLSVEHAWDDIELHMVDRVTIPLAATGAVALQTRDTTTVVVGL